jgi:hypothetical protein
MIDLPLKMNIAETPERNMHDIQDSKGPEFFIILTVYSLTLAGSRLGGVVVSMLAIAPNIRGL